MVTAPSGVTEFGLQAVSGFIMSAGRIETWLAVAAIVIAAGVVGMIGYSTYSRMMASSDSEDILLSGQSQSPGKADDVGSLFEDTEDAEDPPTDDPVELFRRAASALQAGEREKAVDSYYRILEIQPDNVAARYALSELLIEDNLYREAIGILEPAVEVFPGDPDLHLALAQAQGTLGNRDDMVSELKLSDLADDEARAQMNSLADQTGNDSLRPDYGEFTSEPVQPTRTGRTERPGEIFRPDSQSLEVLVNINAMRQDAGTSPLAHDQALSREAGGICGKTMPRGRDRIDKDGDRILYKRRYPSYFLARRIVQLHELPNRTRRFILDEDYSRAGVSIKQIGRHYQLVLILAP